MSYSETKKPLYRKVNTKARGVRHGFGGDFSHVRHAKRVGSNWDEVFSEANARIDRPDPIFWLVALTEDQKRELVCMGESSFFTGLYVDESNILQIVNPNFKQEDLIPSCTCCTHTLNGIPISKAE